MSVSSKGCLISNQRENEKPQLARNWGLFSGSGDGTRTRDLLVGNEKLYQLSYSCITAVNQVNIMSSRNRKSRIDSGKMKKEIHFSLFAKA